MAFQFDTREIADKAPLHEPNPDGEGEVWSSVTLSIAFAMMYVGMPNLTKHTAPEFWRRLSLLQAIAGPITGGFIAQWPPVMVTWQDIQAHIGLGSNAAGKTLSVFLKDAWGWHTDVADRTAARATADSSV